MKQEEYILECRGLNFNEYCELEEQQKAYQDANPDDANGLGRLSMKFIMEKFTLTHL